MCYQVLALSFFALLTSVRAIAGSTLDSDQLKMLQDSGGWQYIEVSDAALGVQTEHPCFDGHPHPGECSGTLTLTPNKAFVESLLIQGKGYQRRGTYQLDGDQLILFDSLAGFEMALALDSALIFANRSIV